MPLVTRYTDLAKVVQAILVANKPLYNLKDVFYGDQARIPRTPTVVVEPGEKRRTLNGMPRKTDIQLTIYLIVYHYQIASTEAIRENNDELAEDLEELLHLDAQLRDVSSQPRVIDSMVTSIESGFQPKRNSLFRASRLTFEARSQELLPTNTP